MILHKDDYDENQHVGNRYRSADFRGLRLFNRRFGCQIPAEEHDAAQIKKTQRSAVGVAVFGVVVSVLLIFLYVLPYQSATDTLRDGSRLDWLTGEAILALGWAALFVPLGAFTYKAIGRSYGTEAKRKARGPKR